MTPPRLLLVDDDPGVLTQLKWALSEYELSLATDRASALDAVRRWQPPVVTLDLGLPPDPANASEGLLALSEILRAAPSTKVIVVTGNDDREVAIRAVALGAYDFYEKPVDPDVLRLIIARAQRLAALESENQQLIAAQRNACTGLIAASASMLEVCRRIERLAPTSATVLLQGESGTGKEVLARAIHEQSPRHAQAFVAINCAAIPEQLLESELFGYEPAANLQEAIAMAQDSAPPSPQMTMVHVPPILMVDVTPDDKGGEKPGGDKPAPSKG